MFKKFFLLFLILIFLNGCVQSTAMIGPAYTLVSTGNIVQASASLGANKIVESETGMTTSEHISKSIVTNKKKKFFKSNKKFIKLVNDNIEKTRIILKNQKVTKNNNIN